MSIDYEFACQDDCLDKMVPSDLRKLICERDQAYRNVNAVKAERDALAAQVSRMSTFIKLSAAKWENCHEVYHAFWNLLRVANETPQQHLAELKAEAGQAGFVAGVNWVFNTDFVEINLTNSTEAANQYADSILQEK